MQTNAFLPVLTGPQLALLVTQETRHPCEHYKGNRNLSGNSHEPCLQLRRPGWCYIASTMPANSGTWFQKLSSTEVCVWNPAMSSCSLGRNHAALGRLPNLPATACPCVPASHLFTEAAEFASCLWWCWHG